MAQNRHVGTQKSHWDKTNKGNYNLKLCVPFVGLTLVRLLRPSMAVLYHVNGKRKGPIARFWQDSILRGFIFAMLTGKYEKKGFTFRDLRATVRKYRPSSGKS